MIERMELNKLPKIAKKSGKRRGRGIGSGKGGHTVGRGSKGQKSKGKVPLVFEGTKIKKSLLKRLPLLRGKGRLAPRKKSLVVNVKYLNLFSPKEEVTVLSLRKHGIIPNEGISTGVKILGEGELNIPLVVKLPVSQGAKKKIEKAGGSVQNGKENK